MDAIWAQEVQDGQNKWLSPKSFYKLVKVTRLEILRNLQQALLMFLAGMINLTVAAVLFQILVQNIIKQMEDNDFNNNSAGSDHTVSLVGGGDTVK